MNIRNWLEDFHVRYLTDAQMAELNPIIRRATLGALIALEESDTNPAAAWAVSYLLDMVPDYWEIPDEEEVARTMGLRDKLRKRRQQSPAA